MSPEIDTTITPSSDNREHPRSEWGALTAALAEEPAESWRWNDPGDELLGYFERLTEGTTSAGMTFPVAVLRRSDGTRVRLWLFHAALRQQVGAARPRPGEKLAVRYLGKRESAAGRDYHAWRVVSERQLADAGDWDRLEEAHPTEEDPW